MKNKFVHKKRESKIWNSTKAKLQKGIQKFYEKIHN